MFWSQQVAGRKTSTFLNVSSSTPSELVGDMVATFYVRRHLADEALSRTLRIELVTRALLEHLHAVSTGSGRRPLDVVRFSCHFWSRGLRVGVVGVTNSGSGVVQGVTATGLGIVR